MYHLANLFKICYNRKKKGGNIMITIKIMPTEKIVRVPNNTCLLYTSDAADD